MFWPDFKWVWCSCPVTQSLSFQIKIPFSIDSYQAVQSSNTGDRVIAVRRVARIHPHSLGLGGQLLRPPTSTSWDSTWVSTWQQCFTSPLPSSSSRQKDLCPFGHRLQNYRIRSCAAKSAILAFWQETTFHIWVIFPNNWGAGSNGSQSS